VAGVMVAPIVLGLLWERLAIKVKAPGGFEAEVSTVGTSKDAPKEAPKEAAPDRVPARPVIPTVTTRGQETSKDFTVFSVAFAAQAQVKPAKVSRGDLMIVTCTALESPGKQDSSGHVGVPSVAMNGAVVFYSGNWYAALSQNGGHEFRYLSPAILGAKPSDQKRSLSFCRNPVITYLPSIDTFVWIREYGPSTTGDNIHRLAFAKTKDVLQGNWLVFDITPQMLKIPGAYLSFPDLAGGANYLYVTTNFFLSDKISSAGAAVLRIPFSSIAKGEPSVEKFVHKDLFSFRVAQNCRETAFFAAHRDTSTLVVFSWPESEKAPLSHDVPIPRWLGGNGYRSRALTAGPGCIVPTLASPEQPWRGANCGLLGRWTKDRTMHGTRAALCSVFSPSGPTRRRA
jgi:hypothetical protein